MVTSSNTKHSVHGYQCRYEHWWSPGNCFCDVSLCAGGLADSGLENLIRGNFDSNRAIVSPTRNGGTCNKYQLITDARVGMKLSDGYCVSLYHTQHSKTFGSEVCILSSPSSPIFMNARGAMCIDICISPRSCRNCYRIV